MAKENAVVGFANRFPEIMYRKTINSNILG